MDRSWLGRADVDPSAYVIAGSLGRWAIKYVVGRFGVDDGGSIRIARRSVCDSERPQFDDPEASGYTTVTTSGDVRLIARYDDRSHIRPWRGSLQIDVRDGSLREGDEVLVTFGDQAGGGPGIRMQTFREDEHIFKVLVDPFGTGRFEEIERSPSIRIIGGPADKIQVTAPSYAVVGSPITATVRALDTWGNRSDDYAGIVYFTSSDPAAYLPNKYEFTGEDRGARSFEGVVLNTPGLQTISVVEEDVSKAMSNPIAVLQEEPPLRLFWGDFHGQTKQTVGTGTLNEYFSFARDVSAVDFAGWQGNDFQITQELWKEVREATMRFNEPGRFVTFLGYEWSGLTPAGGDYNIYFLDDIGELNRSSHWLIDDKSDEGTDRYPISKLWQTFHGRGDVMAVGHVGGRHANLDYFDPERVPLIEVHSHHGTFEWFLEEALRRGLKVGFVANGDDHTCRPGLTYPSGQFCTRGGYTGVYASELTREALWEALWSRRCYATTGERIILQVEVDGHVMGEEYETDTLPQVSVRVVGTAPLHEVEVKRGVKTVYRHPFARPREEMSRLIKVEWSGVRVRSRIKKVDWEGGLYLDRGKIVSFSEFAFDDPRQGVRRVSNQELEWNSTTCGDPDGVILKLEAPDEATITFHSKPVTFAFKPKKISYEPLLVDAGGVDQRVKVSEISGLELPRELKFSYVDERPMDGLIPYWVRAVQGDGGIAWSSPVYVNFRMGDS